MANWYLAENDGLAGPFPFELLRQLASAGRLRPTDRVRPETQTEWTAASEVPGLFQVTSIAAKTMPAPLEFRAVEIAREPGARYWLLEGLVPVGPYSSEQLQRDVRDGKVAPEAQICKVGTKNWRLASECFEFAKPTNGLSPQNLDAAESTQRVQTSGRTETNIALPGPSVTVPPWHPVTIALLGIPFTPVWAGIMAALNAERLGLKTPLIRPIAIAAGAFAIDLIAHRFTDVIWITFALYFGSLLAIWSIDLAEQWEPYRQARQTETKSAGIGMPILAGCVLVGVCLSANDILYPPDFREVCNRFAQASDVPGKKAWCTDKLWAVMGHRMLGETWELELLDDFAAKPPLNGHFVSFRQPFVENNQILVTSGTFHLIRTGERWRIDEIFITNDGFGPLAQPVALGAQIAVNNPPPFAANPWQAPGQNPAKNAVFTPEKKVDAAQPIQSRHVWAVSALLSKAKIPAVVIAAIGGAVAMFRRPASGASSSTPGNR